MIHYNIGVPSISVICDGGWSKRTHKHSYNAMGGVGVIIGAKTKKLKCRKVWLHCLKTDHMAHKPSSKYVVGTTSMHASSKGVKRFQLWQLFSVDEGRERIQIPFFSGPSSVLQRNAI